MSECTEQLAETIQTGSTTFTYIQW